ncbi:DUF3794 domain-containing protein [Anaerosinus massiliensis]|uniref:DUF3794 domain-containing protein n=1 Tax=Massilibacillus massiliensis TaxID=1806837 RepID=UPI0018FEA22A|nr:DUF3794 domain-containing protein [Massilibacillus massiliensis]
MKDGKRRFNQYMMPDYCTLGAATGPQTIVVRQVLGEREEQKILDIHVCVPKKKPSIEQIVDVFVKNVEVNSVDCITDHVMVRGEFEVKVIYVACLPDQPVHAVELKHIKWLQDISMIGARRGMDADATATVEFVDYDVPEMSRAYKYKYHGDMDDDDHDHMYGHDDPCGDPCDDPCDDDDYPHHHHHPKPPCPPDKPICPPKCPPMKPDPHCKPCCEEVCFREFDVSVMLRINAKVLADREVQINPPQNMTSGAATQPAAQAPAAPELPSKPKG